MYIIKVVLSVIFIIIFVDLIILLQIDARWSGSINLLTRN